LFAVSIGLLDGPTPLIGVVTEPALGRTLSACAGRGSLSNGQPFRPRAALPGKASILLSHGYAPAHRAAGAEVARRLAHAYSLRKLGASALELAYVATGRADAYITCGNDPWDVAGGIVLASEAGCVISDWAGNPWDGTGRELLVCRAGIHAELVTMLSGLSAPS
jgi:myo-inositol-1(or 4)-monophosphatase